MSENTSTEDDFKVGQQCEHRRASRRKTLAELKILKGPAIDEDAAVTNLSGEGAFISTVTRHPVGTRFLLSFHPPTGVKHPIKVGAKVVRVDDEGMAIIFEDIHTKDRNKLKQYAGYSEMDDAVVRVQRSLNGVLSGNLLPVSDRNLIITRLRAAANKNLQVLVIDPTGGISPIKATIDSVTLDIRLQNLEQPIPEKTRVVYVAIIDGPMQYLFEGLVVERGRSPLLMSPERMYHNERRSDARILVDDTWLEMEAPHMDDGSMRLPVVDVSDGGCSIRLPKNTLITSGMRLPSFQINSQGRVTEHPGAVVGRMTSSGPAEWLIGLRFSSQAEKRDAFAGLKERKVKTSFWTQLTRISGVAKERIRKLVVPKTRSKIENVHVSRYKNNRGDMVVSLLDANFDIHADIEEVDVAVVIAPAFLKRKEIFSLLARTLVDNFSNQKQKGVVLRFDATHTVGESEMDPELVEQGNPYLRWTFSHLESDIQASLMHLERRFRPKKRVVLTFSVAAMAARRMIADNCRPTVDLWIAPFGCPDAQDMFQNYLAGIDLFQNYLKGEKADPFLIYGRLADPNFVFPDSMERGMAFLDQAKKDLENITCPVTWIVGTYDYMVTRERVRQLLAAPGGGIREVFEMPSGHILKTGAEAIESFKLISESISRHIFGHDVDAIDPDLAVGTRQAEAEWARVKRIKMTDATDFWDRHLFGTGENREGYDVLLHNPTYVDFLEQQAKILNPKAGDRIADIGCGTGNLTTAMLERIPDNGHPVHLSCLDLVPAAIKVTEKKIQRIINDRSEKGFRLGYKCRVIDLEEARLAPVRDFLQGRLFGLSALSGRIEGLHGGTITKLQEVYNQRLHDIVRGAPATQKQIKALGPDLDDSEIRTVVDMSRASRFVQGVTLPEDLIVNHNIYGNAKDIHFNNLNFGPANSECRLNIHSEAFDRIGCSLVLSYVFDPQSVLEEFYRILAPGGRIVLSSLKPNFEASKSYLEEAQAIATKKDLSDSQKQRLLDSLREFASFVGCVSELEDEGRFKFFSAEELAQATKNAGFRNVQTYYGFGEPPTAVIVSAEKET